MRSIKSETINKMKKNHLIIDRCLILRGMKPGPKLSLERKIHTCFLFLKKLSFEALNQPPFLSTPTHYSHLQNPSLASSNIYRE